MIAAALLVVIWRQRQEINQLRGVNQYLRESLRQTQRVIWKSQVPS